MSGLLESFFELNRQQIQKILDYREAAEGREGLERVVETSTQLNKLTEEQMRLLELLLNQEEKANKNE